MIIILFYIIFIVTASKWYMSRNTGNSSHLPTLFAQIVSPVPDSAGPGSKGMGTHWERQDRALLGG